VARPRGENGGPPARRTPEPLPWEKQKGETRVSFSAFAIYRDLGPHRSLSKTAAAVGKSLAAMKGHSTKYGWVERADAYDDFVDRRLREERETERIRLERAQLGLGSTMVGLALRRLNGAPPGVNSRGEVVEEVVALDPNTLDAGDVVRLATDGVRIQRLAAGLATDLIRGTTAISAPDVVKLARDLVEILSRFIPEDRQARAFSELEAYIESGQRL
jgi:hypothetical protein